MKKFKKVIWLAIIIFLATIGYFLFKNNSIPDTALAKVEAGEVEITPPDYDIGTVIMRNGNVIKEYEIKNKSANPLRLKKIATSCMCTKAQVISGDKKTRFYAMEMGGALNPIVDFDIPGNSTAKVIVKFDPAAHGIKGVGKIEREVNLEFIEPVGIKKVTFSGEVVLK